MTALLTFTNESSLENQRSNSIIPFWQQGEFSHFIGVGDKKIAYASFIQPSTAGSQQEVSSIIIVPGRTEGYLKYQELTFDLFLQGFNIFIIDHRGQGLSERLLTNPHKGYVKNFQDYTDDLAYFINNIVSKKIHNKPYLLAHSMGGAIATRYMQIYPNTIKAATLVSPMLGFNTGFIPLKFAKWLANTLLKINTIFKQESWYFLGQGNYEETSFERNKLTHSKKRYQISVDLYHDNKALQLGGVTLQWLIQSTIAQDTIFNELAQLTTPITLIQGSEEQIVCQQAQNDFCKKLSSLHPVSCPNGKALKIQGGFHELLFEVDSIRNKTINYTLDWFMQHKD